MKLSLLYVFASIFQLILCDISRNGGDDTEHHNNVEIIEVDTFDLGVDLDQPIDDNWNYFNEDGKHPLNPRDDDSKGLQEFTPIRNKIGQSQTQFYSFSVDTSSGLGEYYEFLIFLTGNICSQPDNIKTNDSGLTVYYSFDPKMFNNFALGDLASFQNGYFQALADVPLHSKDNDSVLYIAVKAPENTDKSAQWQYEVGVSQNDLVFQWDDRSWASLVDTDDRSALIVTGNLTRPGDFNSTSFNTSSSRYSLYLYAEQYENYFDQLNSSWCAIRSGPALFSTNSYESSFTTRGGGFQQQFYVEGLNSSTKYIAYLVSDFSGQDFGGAVYQPFTFETMSGPACSLIYDLDFCSQVAYSVPNNPQVPKQQLLQTYDDRARSLYQNFSYALQQIPCNSSKDEMFSPIKDCDDCADAYKDWLCAVTIPRCSTRNITGYKERKADKSRNDFVDEVIRPSLDYYEVLPCLNVCHTLVRDCPAAFGFDCPEANKSARLSYYWDAHIEFPTCNYVGKTNIKSSGSIVLTISYCLLFGVILINLLI